MAAERADVSLSDYNFQVHREHFTPAGKSRDGISTTIVLDEDKSCHIGKLMPRPKPTSFVEAHPDILINGLRLAQKEYEDLEYKLERTPDAPNVDPGGFAWGMTIGTLYEVGKAPEIGDPDFEQNMQYAQEVFNVYIGRNGDELRAIAAELNEKLVNQEK